MNKVFMCCLLALVLLFTAGCGEQLQERPDSSPEESDLDYEAGKDVKDMEQEKAFLNESIPPLDQQLPARLETATLGLG